VLFVNVVAPAQFAVAFFGRIKDAEHAAIENIVIMDRIFIF
jgi:hypothetical protein